MLSSITFESGSKLTLIANGAFDECFSLRAICIPASVETLGEFCFKGCTSLSCLTFESGSKLTRIERFAFSKCSSLQSLCIPASLQMIAGSALNEAPNAEISIEEGNCHLTISENFLMNATGTSAILYFGKDPNLTLNRNVEILCTKCFQSCALLTSLSFQSGSRLRRIEASIFSRSAELRSLCIPASVEVLCKNCLASCVMLSTLTFESGSRLTRIEAWAFFSCQQLKSICIPASVQMMDGSAFGHCGISKITIERGNRYFRVSGKFLTNSTGTSLIRYFGSDATVRLNRDIEVIGRSCFAHCSSVRSLTFESDSKLTRIEANGLSDCRFTSIQISKHISELERDWAKGSALNRVIFESASSLRIMIETGKADLRGAFKIEILNCDCELSFPGLILDTAPHARAAIRLLRTPSLN
jgi:hypothetical protein